MVQHRLYKLRGKAYAAKYKELYEELKEVIEQDVNAIKTETGKFSLDDFGKLCMKYRIPASAMDRYLTCLLPNWGHEWAVRSHQVKAKDIGIIWTDEEN